MPGSIRADNRAALTHAILERASEQLAEVGPAALSVRQIARDLGMASSAVYRYFPSRDALLTALVVRAYDDLGEAVETGAAAGTGVRGRFTGAAHGLRGWARAHPHEYALIYGSPVPGYAAPVDTVAPAVRVALVLLGAVRDAQVEGGRVSVATRAVSAAERASVAPVRGLVEPALDDEHTARALMAYATLFGQVSLELFGHMHNAVLDPAEHFATVVEQLADDLGLEA